MVGELPMIVSVMIIPVILVVTAIITITVIQSHDVVGVVYSVLPIPEGCVDVTVERLPRRHVFALVRCPCSDVVAVEDEPVGPAVSVTVAPADRARRAPP